jgi:hypothetical protein
MGMFGEQHRDLDTDWLEKSRIPPKAYKDVFNWPSKKRKKELSRLSSELSNCEAEEVRLKQECGNLQSEHYRIEDEFRTPGNNDARITELTLELRLCRQNHTEALNDRRNNHDKMVEISNSKQLLEKISDGRWKTPEHADVEPLRPLITMTDVFADLPPPKAHSVPENILNELEDIGIKIPGRNVSETEKKTESEDDDIDPLT